MKYSILLLLGILAFTGLAYQNSLNGQFVFDDTAMQQWLGGHLPEFVQREMGLHHRPIQWASYWMNFKVGKGDPFVYHLSNLIVHFIAVSLVFFIVRRLHSLQAGAFGALAFAVHPFFTGAVDYVYARGSMFAAMFVYAAILAGLTIPSAWRWPLIGVLLTLGVASKEEALIFPVFVFGYCVVERKWKWAAASVAAMLAGVLAVSILAPQVGTPLNTRIVNPVWDLVINYGQGLYLTEHWEAVLNGFAIHTLGNLALPLWLTPDPELVHGGYLWLLSAAIVIGVLIVGLLPMFPRMIRLAAWAILASPILGSLFILVAEPVFEYRQYVSGLALAIFAGYLFAWIWERSDRAAMVVGGALVVAMTIGTFHRNQTWATTPALWEDALKKTPNKKRPVLNLSAAYMLMGRHQDSERILVESLKVHPGFRAGHVNLAAVYLDKGDCLKGEPHARAGVPVAISYAYIGLCRIAEGNNEQGMVEANKAIRIDPNMVFARMVRLTAIRNLGKLESEMTVLEATVAANPKDSMLHIELALAYRAVGAEDLAAKHELEARKVLE